MFNTNKIVFFAYYNTIQTVYVIFYKTNVEWPPLFEKLCRKWSIHISFIEFKPFLS